MIEGYGSSGTDNRTQHCKLCFGNMDQAYCYAQETSIIQIIGKMNLKHIIEIEERVEKKIMLGNKRVVKNQ